VKENSSGVGNSKNGGSVKIHKVKVNVNKEDEKKKLIKNKK